LNFYINILNKIDFFLGKILKRRFGLMNMDDIGAAVTTVTTSDFTNLATSTTSSHHYDVEWCTAGPVTILYHANISVNIGVQYDQRTVFGSHGAYAVWTGTDPRSYSISANLVAANADEVAFNLLQIKNAHDWTQESPPSCQPLRSPITHMELTDTGYTMVRIEGYDASIDEAVHLDRNRPIQISLSLTLKECKPI